MVSTSEATDYLGPGDVTNGEVCTVGPENTHKIVTFEQGNEKRKRVAITVLEHPKPAVLNSTSRKALEQAWGYDTGVWAGKKIQARTVQMLIRGQISDVLVWQPYAEQAPATSAVKKAK